MELENLIRQLNSDNHNKCSILFQIINAVRLKIRVKTTNEESEGKMWVWKESKGQYA
jgi:hypothetical protein